jgi:hypothetical protein
MRRMTESEWRRCEDARRMARYLLRHPPHRPTARKAMLFAFACSRSCWPCIRSEKARLLVGYFEEAADDFAQIEKVNSIINDVLHEFEATNDPATAVTLTHSLMPAVDAVLAVPGVNPTAVCDLVREIFGNPFRPARIEPDWLAFKGGLVPTLARAAYEERMPGGELDPDRFQVLADALEEAGCCLQHLLAHLRSDGPHYLGCWALDAVLGKTRCEPVGAM